MNNKILTYLKSKALVQLFFFLLLLHTASCGKNATISTSSESRYTNNEKGNGPSSGPLNIELTSSGQAEGSDTIEFQLTNKGSEDIDVEKMQILLEITDGKDANGQNTKAGKLLPTYFSTNSIQAGSFNIKFGSTTTQPAVALIGKQKLAANQSANIVVKIVESNDLASAMLTCQIVGGSNKEGNPIIKSVVPLTFAPIAIPQKGDITTTIKKAQFTGATNELTLEFAFQNVSDRTVNLASLQFNLELDGTIKGKTTYSSQELFTGSKILEPGKTIEATPQPMQIKKKDVIEALKLAVGTNDLIVAIQIATPKAEEICNVKQPVKLISPDIEGVGPKQGSKIDHTLDAQQIILNKDGKLVFPITFHNVSDHAIDLRKLEHEVRICKGSNVIQANNYKAGDMQWGNCILGKGDDNKLDYSLPKNVTDHILGNNTSDYTFEFITKSATDQQLLGSVKQPFKVKVGPITGESKVEANISPVVDLQYDQEKDLYEAVFKFTIKNTSSYVIDLNKIYCDISIKEPNEQGGENDLQWSDSTNLLNPSKEATLSYRIGLGDDKTKIENYLAATTFQVEVAVKNSDGTYVLGTNKQQVKFNK